MTLRSLDTLLQEGSTFPILLFVSIRKPVSYSTYSLKSHIIAIFPQVRMTKPFFSIIWTSNPQN